MGDFTGWITQGKAEKQCGQAVGQPINTPAADSLALLPIVLHQDHQLRE